MLYHDWVGHCGGQFQQPPSGGLWGTDVLNQDMRSVDLVAYCLLMLV